MSRTTLAAGLAFAIICGAGLPAAARTECEPGARRSAQAACLSRENRETMKALRRHYSKELAALETDCREKFTTGLELDLERCVADKLAAEKKRLGLN
jgi:hypothetical protein